MQNADISLNTAFDVELSLTQALYELLMNEHDMLVSRELDQLPALIEQKEQRLMELNRIGAQRLQLCQKMMPPKKPSITNQIHLEDGLEKLLRKLENDGQTGIIQKWHSLKTQLRSCKRQNEINGRLINASRRNVEKLLIAVKGYNPQSQTYDRRGQSHYSTGSRASTQA